MNTGIIIRNLIIKSLLAGVIILLSYCTDEEINITCADPIGSEDITVKSGNIICFSNGFDGCFIFEVSGTVVNISAISLQGGEMGTIADVGIIDCLGKIDDKPSTGFLSAVQVIANHGYVTQLADSTYGRLYVDSFVNSLIGNEVEEVNIIWQYTY